MRHLVGLFPHRMTMRAETRASPENPRYSLNDPRLWDALTGGEKAKSGQNVNMQTALGLTAVLACVRVLAEAVASIPLIVYERLDNGGKKRANAHPMYTLLHDRPNGEHPSFVWRETLMAHLALRGNAFIEKEYDNRGRIIGLWPIRPDLVTVERQNGRKRFSVVVNGAPKLFTPDDIMHVPGLGYDGLVGYSPISLAREALGLALAAQEHASRYFENGGEPGGVLQHPGKLSSEAATNLRESYEAKHRGTGNAHRVFIAEEGMTWQTIGVTNRDLQFIENRKFQISEIARIYRVPPHMVGDLDRATFSNIEQQSIDFVVHTLRPWLVRWEQVLNWELFSDRDRGRYFAEFSVEGLLRGDSAARGAFYAQMFQVGGFSINDILGMENRNPVPGGDQRFVPMNMIPLDRVQDVIAAQIDKQKQPSQPAAAGTPLGADQQVSSDTSQRVLSTLQPMVRDVLERALMRESTAAKRVAKRGKAGLHAWLTEYQSEQQEFLVRALTPVVQAATAMLGVNENPALVRSAAAGEVACHVAAYRLLENPTEDVVAMMLETFSGDGLETTTRNLTAQLIGALAITANRRTAA